MKWGIGIKEIFTLNVSKTSKKPQAGLILSRCCFLAYLIKSRCMVQLENKNRYDNYLAVNCEGKDLPLCLKFTEINKI